MAGDQRLAGFDPLKARLRQSGEGQALEDAVAHHQQALARQQGGDRPEEQPAQLGERALGGDLDRAVAAAGEEIAGHARHALDLGAPGELEALQGIGSDGPKEAPLLPQPVLQQQGVAVEQPALDLGGAPGPRLGQGGVAGIAGAQPGPHPVELGPAAPELRLDRPQLLRGDSVLAQVGLTGDEDVDLLLDLPLVGTELRSGSAVAKVRTAGGQPVDQRARQQPLVDFQCRAGTVLLHQQFDQEVVAVLLSGKEGRASGVARLAEAVPLDRREGFFHEPASRFEIAAAAQNPGLSLEDPGHIGRIGERPIEPESAVEILERGRIAAGGHLQPA